ncbi:MAG: cytochrome d ubiquinol oxidase subunit II [Myxococcota bacterium]
MSTLEIVWFILVASSLAVYVVLDGFDLGAGILHLRVAKHESERRALLRSIGPVWDGNEVWLIAGSATLFLAFPTLFSVAFSGFYLPLMLVLWLLLFRALGIELRHQLDDPLWKEGWDVAFSVASTLLAFAFGVALGNVVRGVTFNEEGTFFAPLWTHLGLRDPVGVLDIYTILVGISAVVVLAYHGGLWIAARTDETLQARAKTYVRRLAPAVVVLLVVLSVATWIVQPNLATNVSERPLGLVLPIGAVGAFAGSIVFFRKKAFRNAFRASCVFVFGLVASAAYAVFPMVLPGRSSGGLSIADAAGTDYALTVALYWWIPGILLATSYFIILYRSMPATFSVHDDSEH